MLHFQWNLWRILLGQCSVAASHLPYHYCYKHFSNIHWDLISVLRRIPCDKSGSFITKILICIKLHTSVSIRKMTSEMPGCQTLNIFFECLFFQFYFNVQITCQKIAILTCTGADKCWGLDCFFRSDNINNFSMWISSAIVYKEEGHLCRCLYTWAHRRAQLCTHICTVRSRKYRQNFSKIFCILP